MNIHFNLKSKSATKTAIRVVITHKGKVYRRNTGITTTPSAWAREKTGNAKKDRELKRIMLGLLEQLDERSDEGAIITALDEVVSGIKKSTDEETDTPSFWKFFKERSERPLSSYRQNMNAYYVIKKYMGENSNWDDINSAFFLKLVAHMDKDGLSKNYQGTIINKLKATMNEGMKMKYHNNDEFKSFTRFQEASDTVYLTKSEVDKIWNSKPVISPLQKARDLFILGVYTAARFSDYSKLTMDNITGDTLRYIQGKTNGSVIMPVAPRVRAVLERNGGRAPKMGQIVFNRYIKILCRQVGITETVIVTRSKGKRHIQEMRQKCELVSSHTARRTGATLLYLNGVPIRQCMFITGHTSEDCFMKYIRVTKEETAKMLSSIPFFNE